MNDLINIISIKFDDIDVRNELINGINELLNVFKGNDELINKIIDSITLIINNDIGDYVCAFSGGKDSMVLKYLVDISGVEKITIFNKTSVDPKELLDFIKEFYPDVKWIYPTKTMFKTIEEKGYPTRLFRHCCQVLKHYSYPENTKLIGIRAAESTSRAKRKNVEVNRESKTKKLIISPIFYWTDEDVWTFINTLKLPFCELYKTQKRIGCILCPIQTKKNLEEDIKNYPKFVKAYKFAGQKHLDRMRKKGSEISFIDGDDYFNWWVSGKSITNYLRDSNAKRAVSLFKNPTEPIPKDGKLKVFSCFSGAGGSTMGYKAAGCNVIGALDIDERLMEVYMMNHNPAYVFCESIKDFAKRKSYPMDLYDLDILDGSFPCSSFSLIGNRDKDWGKEKSFKEGQKKQILDTLVFDFIDLADKLRPRIIIGENVKGLTQGKAKKYLSKILTDLQLIGYIPQYYVVNAADMGVPQNRERVFIIAVRKDLMKFTTKDGLFDCTFKLNMKFNEPIIPFADIEEIDAPTTSKLYPFLEEIIDDVQEGECFNQASKRKTGINKYYSYFKVNRYKPINTITANVEDNLFHYAYRRALTTKELIRASTFPENFDFLKMSPKLCLGLSVPPKMMQMVVERIKNDLSGVLMRKGVAKTMFGETEIRYDSNFLYYNGEKHPYLRKEGKLIDKITGLSVII